MRALLDTHTLLWFLEDDRRLSRGARSALVSLDSEIYVSAASAWEIATKVRIGKLPGAEPLAAGFSSYINRLGFLPLAITCEHASHAGSLASAHRDPFDRMLIAQSILEDLPFISNNQVADRFGVVRLW